MYNLFIVRHGDAELLKTTDKDRKLTEKGDLQTREICNQLAHTNDTIQLIIYSTGIRAASTADIIAKALNIRQKRPIDALYNGFIEAYLEAIKSAGDYENIMLVGHNPVVTDLVQYLTGEKVYPLPTSGVAIVASPFDNWLHIGEKTCMWRQLLVP